jgi:hypothetical protein
MNKEEFVRIIKREVRDNAITGCYSILSNPPGKRPKQDLLELSNWFNALGETDRTMVAKIATMVLDDGVFGFFCVLDGVRAIDLPEERGQLTLHYTRGAEDVDLTSEEGDYLHEIFTCEIESEEKTQVP